MFDVPEDKTDHISVAATRMERKGVKTERGNRRSVKRSMKHYYLQHICISSIILFMKNFPEKIIIPYGIKPYPQATEIEVAIILSNHYNCIIEFLQPVDGYQVKTPDIVMMGNIWEIKSPTGRSKKHTIKGQFSKSQGKKHHLIIDGRQIQLDENIALNRIEFELTVHRSVQRLIYIRKNEEILEIK
jgi:hypothetical protein